MARSSRPDDGHDSGVAVRALSVVRIDLRTNRVTASIPVDAHVFGIGASDSAVWVTAVEDDRVIRIDPGTNRVSLDLHVPQGPSGIAVEGEGAWVTDYRGWSVTAIDGALGRVRWTIPAGINPLPITIAEETLWVRNEGDASVWRIDARTGRVLAMIPVDPFVGSDGLDNLAVHRRHLGGRAAPAADRPGVEPRGPVASVHGLARHRRGWHALDTWSRPND